MSQPRTTRRLTTQIVRRPWKQRIVNDLDDGLGIQMFGHVAKKRSIAPGPTAPAPFGVVARPGRS